MSERRSIATNGRFFPTYRRRRESFREDTFACAEATVEALLATATTSDHPGMLLGKVQSGKTRTFISTLALAFDNGFDLAIILSKNSKALIEQTKKRLEDEFSDFLEEGELEVYDIMTAPEAFTAFELRAKMVFVVKKEHNNLRRMIELVSEKCPALAGPRALIIDDEADNASVGYSQKDGEIEANRIAAQVSDLRARFAQASFLQVTATPYSLYLQPDTVTVSNSPVFSPTRPAFTKLVPVPDEYVGGETYFGDAARSSTPTVESLIHVTVADRELEILKEPDGRRFKPEDCLTSDAIEGLRKAFITFAVGGTIQTINGAAAGLSPARLRYSFLIHSEASRGSHAWQTLIVETLKQKVAMEAAEDSALFLQMVQEAYDDLSQSLTLAGQPVPPFDAVLSGVKEAFTHEHLTIAKVNSDEQIISLLDRTGQLKLRTPLTIFIGGQALDRGVTISNMIGFYYGRRPNKFQQDTVLQHSRMYGYRRQDLAVTRFYTTHYIRAAMFEMEAFDSALRDAVAAGGDQGVQFIRAREDGTIVPCSPNKILVATTQTLRPGRRMLPIGFQSDYKTRIGKVIEEIDGIVRSTCGFNSDAPTLVSLQTALDLLTRIEGTLIYDEKDEAKPFSWDAAKSALIHLSQQASDPERRGNVLLWAAEGRDSARFASAGSHARFIETPDSERTEGALYKTHAIEHPILFLLRQNGRKAKDWRDTPFYWPVIRAQKNTRTVIYSGDVME